MACFADINVSQGEVATYARCGGTFLYPLNCKFTKESSSENIFFKSVKIRQNYGQESVASLFGPPCIVIVDPSSCLCLSCLYSCCFDEKKNRVFSFVAWNRLCLLKWRPRNVAVKSQMSLSRFQVRNASRKGCCKSQLAFVYVDIPARHWQTGNHHTCWPSHAVISCRFTGLLGHFEANWELDFAASIGVAAWNVIIIRQPINQYQIRAQFFLTVICEQLFLIF